MPIQISDESVARLRTLISDFDKLQDDKLNSVVTGSEEDWRSLERRQLNLAFSLIGTLEGVFLANNV